MLVEVKDSKFLRDTTSMALINKDYSAREEYISKIKILSNQRNEINNIQSEINSLKSDMQDIKTLLTELIGKGSNG